MNYGANIVFSQLAANFESKYRAESARPAISLIRKRCTCGRQITAKQLAQAGCCGKCARAA